MAPLDDDGDCDVDDDDKITLDDMPFAFGE